MQTINWTAAERQYPGVNLFPQDDGECECPDCHGVGTHRCRNFATLSPSDDYDAPCETCDGEGYVIINDDRYS